MSKLEDNILQAIDIIVNKAVADAGYDKTIQAVIVECIDKTIGKYKVRYQDGVFYAYSENTDVTYTAGASVYVLIPGNDMSRDKRIIGNAKKLGINYIPVVEQEDVYDTVGKNCVTSSDTFELHSYQKGGEVIVLYDKDDMSNNKISVNYTDLNEYIKVSNNVKCGIQVQTALTAEQQYRGNYGIIFSLDFNDNATGAVVTRDYVLDIDKMTGNPYKLINATSQYAIFDIDGPNFIEINYIAIFCNNFVHFREPVPPADIFISNVEFSAVSRLSDSDISNYSLSIVTPQGTYFDNSSIDLDIKRLEAQLRVKGSVVNYNSQKVDFYWFVQDVSVIPTSQYYNKYGGQGWKCLNNYNILGKEAETEVDIVEWIPGEPVWQVKKSDVVAKEIRYKCVAIYDNSVIYKEVTIKNLSSNYEIIITSDAGTQFYFDIGHPTLKCLVNGAENDEYTYSWAVTDNSGSFQTLPATAEQNDAYNALKKEHDDLAAAMEDGSVPRVTNQEKLDDLAKQLKEYDLITRVEGNTLHKVQVSSITNFSTYQCAVHQGDVYLGMASIVLSNNLQAEGAYSLIINDSNYVYKYNEAGVSPASKTVEQPIQIKALTFTIFDNLGNPIDDDVAEHADIKWVVPTTNTLIKIPNSYTPSVVGADTATYSNLMSFSYDIADRYNIAYQRNTIHLTVEYKGMLLSAETNLTFTKEGEPGTNGTEFMCKIVPNVRSGVEMPLYPTVTEFSDGRAEWNYTPAAANVYFRVQLWHNENLIFDAPSDGTSTEGHLVSSITWSVPLNKYRYRDENGNWQPNRTRMDVSAFSVLSEKTGEIIFNGFRDDNPVNIIKCTLRYEQAEYTATIPIISVKLTDDNYRVNLKDYTGFRFAIYANDGRRPTYDKTNPFTLVVRNLIIGGDSQDVSEEINPTYAIDYDWKYLGTTVYIIDNNIIVTTRAQKAISLEDNYDGECKSNALECVLNHAETEVARIHIPIHLYLDTHGNAALNSWDGNTVEIDPEGGVILAPQIGAGEKESDNSFTGLLMGVVKENYGQKEIGLFAYEHGERTIFLDAETGKSEFGKRGQGQIIIDPTQDRAQIYSGNYVDGGTTGKGSGLMIDLTLPEIRYGNGNFSVDKNGNLHSVTGDIGGWIIEGDRLRSKSGSRGGISLNSDGSITGPTWHITEDGVAYFSRLKLNNDEESERDSTLNVGCFYCDDYEVTMGKFTIQSGSDPDSSGGSRTAFYSLEPDGTFENSYTGISAELGGDGQYWIWAGWKGDNDMAFGVNGQGLTRVKDLEILDGGMSFCGGTYNNLKQVISAISNKCDSLQTQIDNIPECNCE